MSARPPGILLQLAGMAGLLPVWRDARGQDRQVEVDTLRSVLAALGVPCANDAQCRESMEAFHAEAQKAALPRLLIVRAGAPILLRYSGSPHYRVDLEDGTCIMGTAQDVGGGRAGIPGIRRPGYHRLSIGRQATTVAVVPQCCPSVPELTGERRSWVVAAQVYSLRRKAGPAGGASSPLPGWEAGGDYTSLGILARSAASKGAAGLAISPVHAMFTADPGRQSPYSPSSRLFLNAMHADPAAVFDADFLGEFDPAGTALLRPDGCMDWPAIHAQRLRVFRRIFERFTAAQPREWVDDFETFRSRGGQALEAHACYEALHAHHAPELGVSHGWQDWSDDFRDPAGVAVRRYVRFHEEEVQFHVFLQWLAARSLAAAHASAQAAGMPLGLIADLAVGTDPRGSHAWSRQQQIMSGVSVGAPPDLFQPRGQDWGLTAFSPRALRQHGYDGFIETVRAALAPAGGLRVDHVLGLERMWLIPAGASPEHGAYLQFPRDDLMDLLCLEAWRHRAIVVGENLGTVPEGFDEILERRGVLGMSVLWFEREDGVPPSFRPAWIWPESSMAMATTHDLPTVNGWWQGRDIHWREKQGQLDPSGATEQRILRQAEKKALWEALQQAGIVASVGDPPEAAPRAEILAYVASAPSVLFSVSLEDIVGEVEQPNLPGAPPDSGPEAAHPNWCRTLQMPVHELLGRDDVQRLFRMIREVRPTTRPREGET